MPSEQIYFNKGLSYDVRSCLQEAGSLQTAKNISFDKEGVQGLRPRFTTVNSTAVNAIHSIKRYLDNILIGDSTHLRRRISATTGNFKDLYSSFANAIWTFREYKDFLIGVNGTDSILFDSKGNLYNAIADNPSSQCAGAAGAAGDPNGTYGLYYSFYITFPNGQIYETGLSPVSADVTVANEKISWSSIGVCSYAALYGTEPTIHRRLYRGPGTGGSLADIYYVTTIEDNTTTTYTDEYSDSELGAHDACQVDDYTTGPSSKYQDFHYGRWFLIDVDNPHRLYYSEAVAGTDESENELLMPLAFESTNWDDIRTAGYGHVDVQGLVSWGTYLYIPLKQTWIRKQGNDPADWAYKKTWSEIGIAAPYTIEKCTNPSGILGVSAPMGKTPGISIFNGQLSTMITSPKFDYIFNDDLNQDYIHKCRAKWDGRIYHLLYPSGSNTEPDKWAAFDLRRSPDIRLAFWQDLNGQSIDVDDQSTKIYIGGSDGYVRQNSGSESIDIEINTKNLVGDLRLTNKIKTLKELRYALDTDSTDVTLEIWIDGTQQKWPDGSNSKSISGSNDLVQVIKDLPPNFQGYQYTLKISGSSLSTFEIYSPWEVEFSIN